MCGISSKVVRKSNIMGERSRKKRVSVFGTSVDVPEAAAGDGSAPVATTAGPRSWRDRRRRRMPAIMSDKLGG